MPLLRQLMKSWKFSAQKNKSKNSSDQDHQKGKQKKQNGDPVYAVHIFHPLRAGGLRISFFQVEIFRDLT